MKKLNRYDIASFAKEVSIFEKLQKRDHAHDHLVDLLAAYEQKESFHFIFPWARFDMLGYWEDRAKPSQNPKRALWLAKQCHGLAQALDHVHHYKTLSGGLLQFSFDDTGNAVSTVPRGDWNHTAHGRRLFGRHGDLKPGNILWYPDPKSIGGYGVFRITDFGSAHFTTEQASRGNVPNSPSYQSPEYAMTKEYSIACDIWALGCIYLEFITWFFGGWRAVEQFRMDRLEIDQDMATILSDKFFTIESENGMQIAEVKHRVKDVRGERLLIKLGADEVLRRSMNWGLG